MTGNADRRPHTSGKPYGVEHRTDVADWNAFCRLGRLSGHWWRRPGWRPGRRFLTWYVLLSTTRLAAPLPVESRPFKPHINVAYCHAEVDAAPLRHRLTDLREPGPRHHPDRRGDSARTTPRGQGLLLGCP
jgi:hypothetical protein